ncbi:4'-phosphopantetheinyl transferase family protein [Acetobacter sp.]
MDGHETRRIKSLIHYKDKRSFVMTRYALKNILSEKIGIDFGCFSIISENGNKPVIDRDCEIYFNVSHSGSDGVICISRKYNVGIDLEPHSSGVFCSELSDFVFNKKEYEFALSLLPEEREKFFLKCWTAKEAYCKLLGYGITENFRNFEIVPNQSSMTTRDGLSEIQLFWTDEVKNHCLCVAARPV